MYNNNHNRLMNGIYFITQTDKEIIDECGSYDKFLLMASFLRQITAFFISFFVFIYGTSLFLNIWQSVIISFFISSLLFYIDMSIIASKWSLNPIYNDYKSVKNRVYAHLAGNLIVYFKIIPRVVFAVAIGYCIATIAEMGIMQKAIDTVLQKDALDLNKTYWQEIDKERVRLKSQQEASEQEINRLSRLIDEQKVIDNQANEFTPSYLQTLNTRQQNLLGQILDQENEIQNTEQDLFDKQAELTLQQGIFKSAEEQKVKEAEDEDRGAGKGPRWRAQNDISIQASSQIGIINSQVQQLQNKLQALNANLALKKESEKQLNDELAKINQVNQTKENLGKSSSQLNEELNNAIALLRLQQENENVNLDKFKQGLDQGGLFYETSNDPLGRYLALKKLHNDPEYGRSALLFSWGLKIFLIILELSPVLTMIFLAPYSFYHQKMRLKRKLFEDDIKDKYFEKKLQI